MASKWEFLDSYTTEEKLRICNQCAMTIMMAGQTYEIDGQSFERADLGEVNKMISRLEAQLASERSGGGMGSVIMRKGRFN